MRSIKLRINVVEIITSIHLASIRYSLSMFIKNSKKKINKKDRNSINKLMKKFRTIDVERTLLSWLKLLSEYAETICLEPALTKDDVIEGRRKTNELITA